MAIKLHGGFPRIYSDCPWQYDNPQDFDPARGGTPYKQMSVADLCALAPLVQQVAAKDCILFHWATFPKLKEAIEVMEAWGFTYTTGGFTWVKLNGTGEVIVPTQRMVMVGQDTGFTLEPNDIVLKKGVRSGQGYYTNANAELCLIGKRGKAASLRVDNSVKQVVFEPEVVLAPMLGHSAKPEEVRDRINTLTGDIPGLELFARPPARSPGWLKVGWEIDQADISVVLKQLIDGEYRRPKAA